MHVTTQRRCLTLLAGGLVLGAAGATAWSLSGIESTSDTSVAVVPRINGQSNPGQAGTQVSDVELGIALRRPLTDPPPPKPRPAPRQAAPTPPPQPTLGLTLVGTIIDPVKSLAIIADAAGQFDVKGVGESLELTPAGVSVKRIDSEQVELQFQGKTSTVKLNRDRRKPKAGKKKDKPRRPNR